METAHFKTTNPNQKVQLSRLGKWASWERITDDIGVITTNNQLAIEDLRQLIQRGIGNVTEITAEERTQLAEKKSTQPSPRKWREEVSFKQQGATTQTGRTPSPPEKGVEPAEGSDRSNPLNLGPAPDSMRPTSTK